MSNYEKFKEQGRVLFMALDMEKCAKKFNLEYDTDYVYITMFQRPYRVSRQTAAVEWSEDGFQTCTEAKMGEAMTIYDLLGASKETCRLSGNFITLEGLNKVQAGTTRQTLGGSMHSEYANKIDKNQAQVIQILESMGGRKMDKGGDISYQLDLFPFYPMWFRFWESDDEFPASINFMFDENACDYLHFETLWYAVGILLERLIGVEAR